MGEMTFLLHNDNHFSRAAQAFFILFSLIDYLLLEFLFEFVIFRGEEMVILYTTEVLCPAILGFLTLWAVLSSSRIWVT